MFDDRTIMNPLSPRLENHKSLKFVYECVAHFSVRNSPEDALKLRIVAVLDPITEEYPWEGGNPGIDEDSPATTDFSRKTAVWAFSKHCAGVSSHPSIVSRSS